MKIADSQMELVSNNIIDFFDRVTKDQYWNKKDIPTGYHIMPQVRSSREHVVWFLPRHETSHVISFLKVDLTIYPVAMKGWIYVTHVTENKQVLSADETYRVIALEDVAAFTIMLLELHKSDYRFLCRDRPGKPTKDITILKFKIPHPGFTRNLSDAKWNRVVSSQRDSIIEALSEFVDRTHCSETSFEDTETFDSYVYKFKSNSNKNLCLTINVQDDSPYTEITLKQI